MISFSHVVPLPLSDAGLNPASGIFGVACDFDTKRRYFITAPSGKGKSTLLHILYGLRKDYTGTVLRDGKDIRTFRPDQWSDIRQSDTGMIFQDLRLFLKLTALENILLKPGTIARKSADATLLGMAEELGMTPFLNQTCDTLSYGQRQRVAILRALSQPFRFILLDEPFSHLDPENTRKACALISEACDRQGAGCLLVSLGETYPIRMDVSLEL